MNEFNVQSEKAQKESLIQNLSLNRREFLEILQDCTLKDIIGIVYSYLMTKPLLFS